MRRRALTAGVGVALLVLAVALALLGRAVLTTPAAVERAGTAWPSSVRVAATQRNLADRAAASLLAADRNDAFAEIVGIYRDAVSLLAAAGEPRGPVRISHLIPKLRSPAERSQALTMAGTLLAYSAGAGLGVVLPAGAQAATATVLAQAREDFRAAIRSDPGNEEAKVDLELLLRQQAEQERKPKPSPTKKSPTTQDTRTKNKSTSGQEHHAGIYATGNGY